jgi:peptidyl-dipeptidase Dcp
MRALLLATVLVALMSSSSLVAQTSAVASIAANPLLAEWTGPSGGVPPFDKVRPELFPPAFDSALAERAAEYRAIADNPARPTFANTVVPMQLAGQRLGRVLAMFGTMTSNMNSPAYQALDREWSPKFAAAQDAITFDPKLFARIAAVFTQRQEAGLNAEQMRLTTRLYDSYVRQGAKLDAPGKLALGRINQELASSFAEFSRKLLADENTAVIVTNEAQLAGLPDSVKAVAAAAAAERHVPGWAIVNTRSAVDPVLTFAAGRALREKVWRAFINRGDNGNANDTNATLARIVKLRADRAHLLGFATHADWRMQDTMAKTPAAAMDLMMRVWPAAVARVREEVADQQRIADADGAHITIEPWDYRFYQEKVRKARYDLDQAQLKPYFELNHIIDASYYAANRLYGLQFKEITGTVPRDVGLFYRDDFARPVKRSGAWTSGFRGQRGLAPAQTVLTTNNNNFARGADGEPVLISLDDATTLFHEFGHSIHAMLQQVDYPGLSGTPRDFVEFPSQVNEHWLLSRDVLDRYARHYQTGAAMPQALLDKIAASNTFNQGFATVEYLASAIVDMKLHTVPDGVVDPDRFERETLQSIGMPREIVMRHRLPQFGHLFQSDAYSAGYYSYLWSDVMVADTLADFAQAGGDWDKATADRFATVLLSTGNETDRAAAYRAFRGRDPDVDALLKKRGFPTSPAASTRAATGKR